VVPRLDLETTQNIFFGISRETYADMSQSLSSGDAAAKEWVEHFANLAHFLGVKVE